MGNLIRRAAPAVVLTGTAVALVALFDPGIHASAETTGAPQALPASSGDGASTQTAPKAKATPKATAPTQDQQQQQPTDQPTEQPAPTAAAADCSSAQEYTGKTANTRWGPVQVAIKVAGGKICDAQALQYPDGDRRSSQISSYSIPLLNEQTVSQNGQISGVSGASYTSYGYYQSLQSALSQVK